MPNSCLPSMAVKSSVKRPVTRSPLGNVRPVIKVCPSTSQRLSPWTVNMVPSAASSGGTSSSTISAALTQPTSSPASRQAAIAVPPVSASRTITTAATVTESPATAPTDRSRSPTTAVSVMPSAAIAATAWVCRMDTAVAGVAKPG
jgi:hypothetical protein